VRIVVDCPPAPRLLAVNAVAIRSISDPGVVLASSRGRVGLLSDEHFTVDGTQLEA